MSDGTRSLAAIMFTDMVGFTALTQSDEAQSLQVLDRHNRLLRPIFPKFHGKEVKTIGDSFLVEFDSALDATDCAVEVQSFLHDYNVSSRDEWKITLRIGIHLGDVVHKDGDVFGDAVNIASRVQPLAEPEGVCVSDQVYGQVRNKIAQSLVKLEPRSLKGVRFGVDVYKVVMPWEEGGSEQAPQLDSRRIAVLPFASMSPDPNDEYFADGLTEELIDRLCQIRELEVIARTSVMNYKKKEKNVSQIGTELKAGALIEGSIRKAGNRIRVTAQLINANTEGHLWSSHYDKDLDDVFAVQSDIAEKVAGELKVLLAGSERRAIEKKPTESMKAYTLYLRGKYLMNRRGLDDLRQAIGLFEEAAKEDPGFALAYVEIAGCSQIIWSNWMMDREANLKKAEENLGRALELDPDSAEAHAARGLLHANRHEWKEAEEDFRKSIALKPGYAPAHHWYAVLLAHFPSRHEEWLKHMEKVLELDPLSPVGNLNYGGYYLQRKEYDRALELFKKSAELGLPTAHALMFVTYERMGMLDEMKREGAVYAEQVRGTFPLVEKGLEAYEAFARGDKETLRRMLPELEANPRDAGLDATFIARFRFRLGDLDGGFGWLERAVSEKLDILDVLIDEDFDGIRNDGRYADLMKRAGFIEG